MTAILRGPDGWLVEVAPHEMTGHQRVITLMALGLGSVTRFMPYAWHGEMTTVERKRGRAYPNCCAREWPRDQWGLTRHDAPKGEPYPWCPEKARWNFGEMTVCPLHAAQMALGIAVAGIPVDGRWTS